MATQPSYPSVEMVEELFPFYERLREEQPVYELPSRPGTFVVSRHEDVLRVLGDPSTFSSNHPDMKPGRESQGIAQEMLNTALVDPPQHGIQRKMISQPLIPRRLAEYGPSIQAIVDALIDDFIDDGRCEFVSAFAEQLPIRVTAAIFGLPAEDFPKLRAWGGLEGRGMSFLPPDLQARQKAIGATFAPHVRELVAAKHADPQDDALSELIALQIERDGEFNLDYMTAESTLLIAGGVITTGHLIGSAMQLLLVHQEQLQRVRADHSLIPRMIEETLRVESPVQWQPRRVTRDIAIGDTTLPAESTVLVNFASANRDDEVFECPAAFDLDRSNVKSHVGFGYGTHFCLGAPLARMEAEIAFATLFNRLGNIRVAGDHELRHIPSVMFRGPVSLEIEFDRL